MPKQSFKTQWQLALRQSKLGLGPIGIGLAMSLSANADGSRVFPSAQSIADDLGIQRKTVTRHRKTLEGKGWLEVAGNYSVNRNGKVYRLTIPAPPAAPQRGGWSNGTGYDDPPF